ncbi:hypothetical protein F5Y18DRAFT_423277 [Xylariaceae sp. FL1019]|nr:hypothetical protein F5Y18DRAFT_423277 [Xylariaceae sp. FL1019]
MHRSKQLKNIKACRQIAGIHNTDGSLRGRENIQTPDANTSLKVLDRLQEDPSRPPLDEAIVTFEGVNTSDALGSVTTREVAGKILRQPACSESPDDSNVHKDDSVTVDESNQSPNDASTVKPVDVTLPSHPCDVERTHNEAMRAIDKYFETGIKVAQARLDFMLENPTVYTGIGHVSHVHEVEACLIHAKDAHMKLNGRELDHHGSFRKCRRHSQEGVNRNQIPANYRIE